MWKPLTQELKVSEVKEVTKKGELGGGRQYCILYCLPAGDVLDVGEPSLFYERDSTAMRPRHRDLIDYHRL